MKYIRRFLKSTLSSLSAAACRLSLEDWKADGNPASKSLMSKTGPTQARPCWKRACSVEKAQPGSNLLHSSVRKTHVGQRKSHLPAAYAAHEMKNALHEEQFS